MRECVDVSSGERYVALKVPPKQMLLRWQSALQCVTRVLRRTGK